MEVVAPAKGKCAASSPTLRGHCLRGLQAAQPFQVVRVIKVRTGVREINRALRAGGAMIGPGVPGKVIDSQRVGGYSPLNFPLLGNLCWAS